MGKEKKKMTQEEEVLANRVRKVHRCTEHLLGLDVEKLDKAEVRLEGTFSFGTVQFVHPIFLM